MRDAKKQSQCILNLVRSKYIRLLPIDSRRGDIGFILFHRLEEVFDQHRGNRTSAGVIWTGFHRLRS